ncbi:MAG: 3-hydroxybutyrate oligomer hydrolase family protein, partial [Candidatus Competibacteraceae bacterium]|nr:3-hydroxybutyrate oligomer hydrolase family protein [Candidatus Competibacteraceae bacterium]
IALYQPCANLGQPVDLLPTLAGFLPREVAENRCTSLAEKGLLEADTLEDRIAEAQQRINDYAIPEEQNPAQASNTTFLVPESIAATYANQYGLFGVEDRFCDFSFAATDANGAPTALGDAAASVLFALSNGIPPTGGVSLVYDAAAAGPTNITTAASPSTGRMDRALDGILCLRQAALENQDILAGIADVRASGDLQGRPAVIVAGRADAILPINFTSRPYYALNQLMEGDDSDLHYYEVTNAHHLDAFNAFPGLATRFVPLHYYFGQALDLMYDHLRSGASLPPSQVVHTIPRGEGTPPLALGNLPEIEQNPPADERIIFDDRELFIPE